MKKVNKPAVINGVLWLAFLLALGSSVQHLAWTFGTVERLPWLGWIAAIAVDSGLAALAYSIQQRRKAKRPALVLWVGVGFFAALSALANFYHALAVESGDTFAFGSLGTIEFIKAGLLSATLPLMVLYLGEIVSADDAAKAEQAAKEAKKLAEREEREARKQAEQAEQPADDALAGLVCPVCGRYCKTQNALNAHAKVHQNGKAHAQPQSVEHPS